MSTPLIIVVAVAAVLVVLLIGAVVLAAVNRRKQARAERRGEAVQLREDARSQTPRVHDALLQADEAEAEAARLRERADRADAEAARLRRDAAAEEATQEETVRRADRIDPDVDPRAKDYDPTATLGERAPVDPETEEAAPPDPLGDPGAEPPVPGSHRGEPEAPPLR